MSEFSHLDASGAPRMVDVGAKSETKRTAIARAVVELNAHTLELLKAKALPKGDVLTVAQVAGIMAAKRTSELIPMCHPLALTHADVRFRVQDEPPSVLLEASASTTGRTGVEMEAIIAAQVAAATIYDMVKAVQKDVVIRDVRLILKSGGKSGLFKTDDPMLFDVEDSPIPAPRPAPEAWTGEGLAVACITLSDKGYAGEREDKSGPALLNMLSVLSPAHSQLFLLPDDPRALHALVKTLATSGWGLIVTTGGTGLSPRDVTPEALLPLLDRRLPGFEQVMFAEGLNHTPHAVLSRCLAGTLGRSMIIALPGSSRAAQENLAALLPVLPHALDKLNGDMRDCGRS
ncbi:bifunctional molybdenum cofactor biosynthesis protein MoaC/MoaB [Mailhella massiliensis]|uniref:Cyclic pyranopterin monophosphate synthase n=1 Tax=Mailhella massiliensis TaxID=1903261 RepID=A0A921AVI1_9BACT|nr:bifunctional molybdenum cofactor biosynthesis protein MoaC/MoaB [Mailhella massiliensis]HJD96577.1 bifunctional molybdenum cofactor biosynthesis protein MoaC/MoaB [Mailhella massiliensis]